MHCVTGPGCRVHVHELTPARGHPIPNGASWDSEQNTGRGPGPLSTAVALTWKLSQARTSTSTLLSSGGDLSHSQVPTAGRYKSSALYPRAWPLNPTDLSST